MRHGFAQYLFYVFQIITLQVDYYSFYRHANNLQKSL